MPDMGEIKAKVTVEYDGSGIQQAKEDIASLADVAGSFGEAASGVGDSLSGLHEQVSGISQGIQPLLSSVGSLEAPFQASVPAISAWSESLGSGQDAVIGMASSIEELSAPLTASTKQFIEAAPPMLAISEHAQSVAEQMSAASDSFAQVQDTLAQSVPLLPQYAESMQAVHNSVASPVFDMAAENMAVLQDALVNPEPFSVVQSHLSETGQTLDEFATSMNTTSETIASLFGSPNNSAATFADQFNGIANVSDTINPNLNENMAVFQDSLENPEPFSMIKSYLNETGQSWGEFSASIGDANTAMLHEMASNGDATHEILGNMSADFQDTGKSAVESYFAMGGDQGFAEKMKAAGLDVWGGEIGGVGAASSGEALSGIGEAFSGAFTDFGNALGSMSQFLMPLMALQMVGTAIGTVATGMYNAAAIAEGPAAHSFGTFTGSVDALGQTMQKSGESFSESFGKQIMPTIDAMNSTMSQNNGSGGIGGALGTMASYTTNAALVLGGLATMTSGIGAPLGMQMIKTGGEGFINTVASELGFSEPFQGPSPSSQQSQLQLQQQLAASTAQLQAQATDPSYLAAQAQLASAQQKAQKAQQVWDISQVGGLDSLGIASLSGPSDAAAALIRSEMVASRGQMYGNFGENVDPNKAFFQQILQQSDQQGLSNLGIGCFPTGTRVLMADNSYCNIETLQIGDKVLAHDGTKQVPATVLAHLVPPPKPVHTLILEHGHVLTLTDSHPVATTQGWKSLDPLKTKIENPDLVVTHLQIGDIIHMRHGTARLLGIQQKSTALVQIYNITVDGAHTFYANDVLVHNKAEVSGSPQSPVFHAQATWVAEGLEHTFTGIASWIGQALEHTFQGVAGWIGQGLEHTFQGVAGWVGQELEHTFNGVADWLGQGLEHTFNGVADWLGQGLEHTFNGIADWIGEGLEHTFQGVAGWVGKDLEHTFTGIASWIGQNLEHTFTGIASWVLGGGGSGSSGGGVQGFASGVENYTGWGIVGEAGPELVNFKGGSVYPLSGGGAPSFSQIPLMGGGGGGDMPQAINIIVQLDSQSLVSQMGIPLAQNIRLMSGSRSG